MFADIVGHQRPKRFLSRAVMADRLPHAYLFTGPEGVGKATLARELAAMLFCRQGIEDAPCGHCPACQQFASDNHPDFLHILPDGAAIKISQIREVKKQLAFAPLSARTRIILIEEAQTMRREAGNSLLKMLEEPPPDNLFLVVASDTQAILPTIVSRCQVIPFAPLTEHETVQVLLARAPELNEEQARLLARITEGAPGQALAMKDGQALQIFQQIAKGLLHDGNNPDARPDNKGEERRGHQVGTPPGFHINGAVAIEEALWLAGLMATAPDELDALLDLLKIFFKEVLAALMTGAEISLAGVVGRKERRHLRERWNLHQLSDKIHAIDHARRALARNCNRGLVCEALLLDLLADSIAGGGNVQ